MGECRHECVALLFVSSDYCCMLLFSSLGRQNQKNVFAANNSVVTGSAISCGRP